MGKLGLIAGTGFSDWLTAEKQHQIETPYGDPSAAITETDIGNGRVLYLPRHGNPHRLAPHAVNYRANIWAMQALGVEQIIAINVVGSIRSEWQSGSLVIPDQIIDYTWGRAHTYFDNIQHGGRPIEHIDFTYPYSEPLRRVLLRAGQSAGMALFDRACYAATQGPRLESAAEVRRIQADGGELIGMTGMPEASLAKELGINYASICLVSNLAAGIADRELNIEEIMGNVATSTERVQQLITKLISELFPKIN